MNAYANILALAGLLMQLALLICAVVFWEKLPLLDGMLLNAFGLPAFLMLLLIRKRHEYLTDLGALALRLQPRLMWVGFAMLAWAMFFQPGSHHEKVNLLVALIWVLILPAGMLGSFERPDVVPTDEVYLGEGSEEINESPCADVKTNQS